MGGEGAGAGEGAVMKQEGATRGAGRWMEKGWKNGVGWIAGRGRSGGLGGGH